MSDSNLPSHPVCVGAAIDGVSQSIPMRACKTDISSLAGQPELAHLYLSQCNNAIILKPTDGTGTVQPT